MNNNLNLALLHILCIGERMFSKEETRTDRPKNGENFSILQIIFICRNKNKNPEIDEPVIGEIDACRHSPVHRSIDVLISAGYMELSPGEVEKVLSTYVPGLKTVPALLEY
jgi:hypothetical protein